jgi:hypothetical protein
MSKLPIVHMTMYKHGVGYFQRRGAVEGESLKLTFRREEMDDLLKSLTVIDHGGGQVRGVDYETPQSQEERLKGCSIILDDRRSLRDLLMALRGRPAQLQLSDGSRVEGLLLGLDETDEAALQRSLVSILQKDSETVGAYSLERIEGVALHDATAAADLRFFLETALGQETHRSITIRLSPGQHDLEVSYIAPAPTWRVSYRLVMDTPEADRPNGPGPKALLQGWGIFDNRLEEDLTDISLSLTAGMPISFVYDLYTPHTPDRPVVKEEDRVAAGPIMFEGAVAAAADMPMAPPAAAPAAQFRARPGRMQALKAEALAETVESAATGKALGELFQYNVGLPVTVGRGQSAMVPIVSNTLSPKKDLIYNGVKMPQHPVATLRFKNSTGLTLERGPVTVLENGEYVGEAVLPFTADEAEAVISYAVELGVHIKEEHRSESQFHALEIKDRYLVQHLYHISRTIYSVDNRTPQSKTILIEQAINGHYTPFDSPDPVEKTLETRRYKVEAPAGKTTGLTIQERQLKSQHEALQNLSYQGLQKFFEGRFLDKQTYEALKALLDIWAEIARLQRSITEQEARREKIYKAQEQIQKNMTALSKDGEEGRLRGRYVKQLTQSEEELAEVDQAITHIQTQIEQKQAQVEQRIAGLAST